MTDRERVRPLGKVDWRVSATAGAWFVVGVGMLLLGMEPRLVLLGFVVLIASAVMWLIVDLALISSPLVWDNPASWGDQRVGRDLRVGILRSRLEQSPARRSPLRAADPDTPQPADQIIETLLGVVDHHLLAEHNIDRAVDSGSAVRLLGPELGRFVTDVAAQRSMTRRRSLAGTIKLIEELTVPTPSLSGPSLTTPSSTPSSAAQGPHDTARTA